MLTLSYPQTLLEQGVIDRLVRLLASSEPGLMLDALWAFKNLVYKSSLDLKRRVAHAIGWSTVARYEEYHLRLGYAP